MTVATEAEHLAAVKALLTTLGAKPHTPADLAALKDAGTAAPSYYTEVSVTQRMRTGPRRDDPSDRTEWRVRVLAVAQRYANAQLMRSKAEALDGATLTVGGETFPVERADVEHDPIGPDDGWWSGVSEFIY